MSARPWNVVLPLVAAAAAMAGIYSYHRLSQIASEPVVAPKPMQPVASAPAEKSSTEPGSGFSFSTYESPRELPEVPFINGNEEPVALSDFKGKTILLNLWATWCVPCREEMPTLDRLEATLGGENFQVVALSLDQEGPVVVKDFYDELSLEHLEIYVDDRLHAPSLLSVIGVPATLLIDRDGREIGRKLGPAEWDSPSVVAAIRGHVSGGGN